MPFYKKKPVVIEALQLRMDNAYEVSEFCGFPVAWTPGAVPVVDIKTLEGTMRAIVGDYVIKEPHPTHDRTFYPCKADIFDASYTSVHTPG